MNRIEAERELAKVPILIHTRTLEALSRLRKKSLSQEHLKEVRDLEEMLDAYIRGDLVLNYRNSSPIDKQTLFTTVGATQRDLPSTVRLNFHSRIFSEDAIAVSRQLAERAATNRAIIDSDQILQINTAEEIIWNGGIPTQRAGIDFKRFRNKRAAIAQGLIFIGRSRVDRIDLGLILPEEDLFAMQGEVIRLSKRPRFSPALQR